MRRSVWARRMLLFLVIGPLAILVFGGVVMLLWNYVLAEVVPVSTINFWQALGIFVLSKILFGFGGGGGGYRSSSGWKQRMQDRWANMSPEEREKYKDKWKHGRCGYKPWDHESTDTPKPIQPQ